MSKLIILPLYSSQSPSFNQRRDTELQEQEQLHMGLCQANGDELWEWRATGKFILAERSDRLELDLEPVGPTPGAEYFPAVDDDDLARQAYNNFRRNHSRTAAKLGSFSDLLLSLHTAHSRTHETYKRIHCWEPSLLTHWLKNVLATNLRWANTFFSGKGNLQCS